MKRRLVNLLAALSMLLCAATVVMWVRSWSQWDRYVTHSVAHGFGVRSAHGRIIVNVRWTDIDNDMPPSGWTAADPHVSFGELINENPLPVAPIFALVPSATSTFGWEHFTRAPDSWYMQLDDPNARPTVGDEYTRTWFPHAMVAAVAAVLPTIWLMRFSVATWRHRRREGYCRSCGYDLRATPQRCPECGTVGALD